MSGTGLFLAAVTALTVAGAVWLVVRLACPYGGGSEQRSDDPER